MTDKKKVLRRAFNRLIFNTPIRSYKDPIEGLDYTTFSDDNDNKKLGIMTADWDVVIDLNTLEVTETDKNLFMSFEYSVPFHIDKDKVDEGFLNKKEEKLLQHIFHHIIMKSVY